MTATTRTGRAARLNRYWGALALCALLSTLAACGGGGTGTDVAAVAQYDKPDRTQMLTAGAMQEKHLVWYTTLIPAEISQPLADAFHQKYPYISVSLYRGDSNDVAQKMIQEYRARSYHVDVIDGTASATILRAANFLQPFRSPELNNYPAQFKDKDGYWGTELLYYMVLAYNKNMVAPADAPRTYAQLLDPKWRDKMAWSTSPGSGAPTFVGNVLSTMGHDRGMAYLHALAEQHPRNVNSSGRSVIDQVIAGQFPIALQVFNHQVSASAAAGAPVGWTALSPVSSQLSRVSLAKQAPDPHAAMLFLDFVFSAEGQQIISEHGDIPADPAVPAQVPGLKPDAGGFTSNYLEADNAANDLTQWTAIYQQLFVQNG